MDPNDKFADDIYKFYDGSAWPMIQYRIKQYRKRLDGDMRMAIRKADMHKANRLEAKQEGADEVIAVINGLAKEIKKGKINLNKALGNERNISYDD